MLEHKQRLIEYGNNKAEVDEGIADLILELWKADIFTWMSCESNNSFCYGRMMWVLVDINDVNKLFDALFHGRERDDLYRRGVEESSNTPTKLMDELQELGRHRNLMHYGHDSWKWDMGIGDYAEEDWGDEDGNYSEWLELPIIKLSNMSLRFPLNDYDEVLKRMKVFNEEK